MLHHQQIYNVYQRYVFDQLQKIQQKNGPYIKSQYPRLIILKLRQLTNQQMQSEKIQTPQTQQPTTQQPKKGHDKGQRKQKKQFKSEYVFDADAIKVDTEIPPLPKKSELLKKPEIEEVKEKEKKIREKVGKLIELKKEIRAENFKQQKTNKKGEEKNKHSTFRNEIQQVKELRERLNQVKTQRNEKRDRLQKLIEEAKQNNAFIKELGGKSKGSKETLSGKLEELENRLMTAKLSKEEEKSLNGEITLLKRKMKDAETVGNIEFKIEKAHQRKEELDHEIERLREQKQPLQKQYTQIKQQLDKKNAAIDGLKKDLDSDKKQFLEQKQRRDKEWEQWKEGKRKRLEETEEWIKKLHEETDRLWEEFGKSKEAYWRQKHYVDWVEWQIKVKTRKVNEVEREKRRLQYEQKDKEYQKQEKLQKYIGEIELCNQLVQYLNNLKADFSRAEENRNDKKETVDVTAKLAADSQWKKEKVEILVSKKSQLEEEQPAKKGKKNKNKPEKKEEQKVFSIPYNVQNQFEALKVLAPSSIEEVDKKIEELRERERLFERGCTEEQVSEEDTKLLSEIKSKKSAPKQAEQKKVAVEEDFPTI